MSSLNLMQRRRSDGTLTLIGSTHSPADEDREFPKEFDFSFTQLGRGIWPATIDGDKITLNYVNAKAVYKIDTTTDDGFNGYHAVLESVELFDAPRIDTDKRDSLLVTKDRG